MFTDKDLEMLDIVETLKKKADGFDSIYRLYNLFVNQHITNEEFITKVRAVILYYQTK